MPLWINLRMPSLISIQTFLFLTHSQYYYPNFNQIYCHFLYPPHSHVYMYFYLETCSWLQSKKCEAPQNKIKKKNTYSICLLSHIFTGIDVKLHKIKNEPHIQFEFSSCINQNRLGHWAQKQAGKG